MHDDDDDNVLILDGGFATQLELPPFKKDLSSELWSAECLITDAESIKAVHKGYVNAGADVISTSSYQLSLNGLLKRGLSEQEAKNVCLESINLANASRGPKTLVALSLGPYGATLADGSEYTGIYSPIDLVEFHRSRLHLYGSAIDEVDIILFETIPSMQEALAIQIAIQDFTFTQVWISFSCKLTGEDMTLSSGENLNVAVKKLIESRRFSAYGINCSKSAPIEKFQQLLSSLSDVIRGHDLRALLYPDGGATWDAVKREWSSDSMSPALFAEQALTWLDHFHGIPVAIGGCCGTSWEHIKALRKVINSKSQ